MKDYLASLGSVDVAALLLVAFQAIMGLVRGCAWQLVRLLTLVGGLLVARAFAGRVAASLERTFDLEPPAPTLIAYFAILFAVVIAGTVAAHVLRSAVAALRLQSYDRLLGLLLGAAKGLAFVVIAVLLLSQLEGIAPLQEALARSAAARVTEAVVERVGPLFPESLEDDFREWRQRIEREIAEQVKRRVEESR